MWKVWMILSLAVLALIKAEENRGECSPSDGAIVRKEWNGLWINCDSSMKITIAKQFILDIVKRNPEAKVLFQNVGIDDPSSGLFSAHAMRIVNSYDALINLLDDREVLREHARHLGHQHAKRPGILKKYFKETFIELELLYIGIMIENPHPIAWRSCLNEMLKEIIDALPE